MKTNTIGELLRQERESHRLSVEQVARLTHIREEYIQQIEANAFDQLPPAVYVKGYVRSIAQIFGVEPEPLLALLRRDYKEGDKGVLSTYSPLAKKRGGLWRGPIKWPAILAGGMLVTIAAYITAQWMIAQRPPPLAVEKLDELTEIASDMVIVGRTSPEAIVLVNEQPAALRPDGSFSYQLQLEQTGLVTIKIEARDERGKSTTIEKTVRVKQPLPSSLP